MRRIRKGIPFLLPLLILFSALYFLLPISSESSDPVEIESLAPVEVLADSFKEPTGVVVDQNGAVFVSDRKSGDIIKITQYEVHPVITDLKRPVGLAFDLQGRLLIVEEKTGRLLRLETNGTQTALAQGMKGPRWVTVAEDGTVYISAKGLKSVKDKDEDDEDEEHGEAILRLTTQGELTVFVDGFKGLQGIVVHENNLFAAAKGLKAEKEDSGAVFKIPILPDGGAGPVSKITKNKIKKPFGLVLDALGALYVSAEEIESSGKHKDTIGKVASDGALYRFASKLEKPRGLALDSFGNLYAADDNGGKKGRIIRFRAPPPPLLTIPAFTKQNPLTVAGTTEANSRIDAFLTDSTNPTNSITLLTQDGSFNLTLPLTPNTQNLFSVFATAHSGQGLTSAPAEFTILHDSIVPLISNLQPANGSFSSNPRPLIRAGFSDNLSGIDTSKVEIRLDGFDVTSQAQVVASGFTLDLLNCLNVLNCPLSQGQHTVSVTVFDRAGNSALASSTFTIDVTAPLIANLTPAHGAVVSTATPTISAQFQDNFGINPVSVRIFLDGADVTSLATINSSGFTLDPSNPLALKLFPLSQAQHTVFVSLSDLAGNPASASSIFTVSLGPQLNPIGNKTVNLGETLSFTVSATSSSGAVSLFISPLPLPNHATFNAVTGLFTFTPDTTQVGSFLLTFSAVSGNQSSSETITITVPSPPPGGVTGVTGRIYNLNNTPLGNVKVTLKSSGHTDFSTADGFFTISGVPSGKQELIINGREANLGVFAILAVPVNLIEGVLNNLPNIITIPDVDVEAEVQVSSVFTTVVSNPSVPGVELEIPGSTATNSDGTSFTGKLSINPVPDYGRPESRPEELRPGMAITIQPAGVRFNPPAPLTFPNADNMVPGSELNLWSLSPDTGTFSIVGKMVVSGDGLSIITTEGGVSASAWHFALASSPSPGDASTGSTFCEACRAKRGSESDIEEGSLYLSHSLPSYRSLGQSRSLSLSYSSVTADPRPIISLNTTLSVRAAVPNSFSTRLLVGGVQQGGEIFTDARSLPEDRDSTTRISAQFDASNLPTGRYPYQATIFSNYQNSSIGGMTNGNVIVLNRKSSALGSGWAVTDLQQLHPQADGSLLLTTGDGRALHFSGGPDTFTSPPGDFSVVSKNPDGTYSRVLKDSTRFNFNAQGLQTSVEDRNGNRTSYSYDSTGRLLTITDPAGLVTTFTYSGARLQKITNPAGRETLFQHDASGNLTRITNPDGSFVNYAYDGKGHAIQATDERGNATTYVYDFAGRFSQSTKPGGETRSLTSSKLQGLADTAGGQGTPINPAPVVRSENATSSLTDGKGNQTTFTLNSLGQIASQTDALGNTTLIERDLNGNPTKITRPNGAVLAMSYDARANLLTSKDPVDGTTSFTYEPSFNQTTSIKAPKGETTTINYDARGNPTEITDGLGDKTQMTYDLRGLLATVTSAVGKPQQNTTSFIYDTRGNLFTTTDPKGNLTTLEYDSAGNVFRSTDGEGRVTEFTYDSFNRLISVLDPSVNVTRYSYDAKGNLTQVIDSRNQITTFNYDALDRLISASNSLGFSESFTYDENGNLTSTTARNSQMITFNYDALNRLIQKTRPPTSTEIGLQATTFSYDSVGNLISAINPVIGVFNQYDLANRLISSTSTTEEAVAGVVVQINADTTIDENNRQFEGRTVRVSGRTLTVSGSHTFANLILANGAVLTHTPTTASSIGRLDIRVTGALTIDATSRIDVTSRGFLAESRPGNTLSGGMTIGFTLGSTGLSGGSYGGLGGSVRGAVNPAYGNFRNPNEPGSGGSGGGSGNGGGLIRIVAQTLQLDGAIVANGEDAGGGSDTGGGSGGGIRIDVGAIRGAGIIRANGGRGGSGGGPGAGGGRVALYYQGAVNFDLTKITAFGTAGLSAATNGGAGTVFLQGATRENGELIADNNGLSTAVVSTPIAPSQSALLALTDIRARRQARLKVEDQISLSSALEVSDGAELTIAKPLAASTVNVSNNGVLTQLPSTSTQFFKIDLTVSALTLDSTSRIDATGRGFLADSRPGNPFGGGMTIGFTLGSTGLSGGSYGGLGGSTRGAVNPVYGDFRNPNEPGSGGAGSASGNGGGLIRIVAQTLQLDGAIIADGEGAGGGSDTGGGSGGGVRIDVGTLRGAGQIAANGGRGGSGGGPGGGGGRAAVYYQTLVGFNPDTQVSAFGGSGALSRPNGAAGTVYLQGPARESGELIADNNGLAVGSLSTPIPPAPSGLLTLSSLRIKRGARGRVDDQINLNIALEVSSAAELTLGNRVIAPAITATNASLITHLFTTGSAFFKVDLNTTTLTIDATSRIDVTGRGFLADSRPGNPFGGGMTIGFTLGSTGLSGGSYGGLGGSVRGSVNPIYGDFRNPNEPGSGGAGSGSGSGGGLIRIVAQILQLDGSIVADGEAAGGGSDTGGGSGGGIRIDVGMLRGTGQIMASGGRGGSGGGAGGGGGRAALYYQNAVGFDLTKITALGGASFGKASASQNGTVFTEQFLAMRSPIDDSAPVMTAQKEPLRLASLALPVVELKPDYGPVRLPDFKELIEKMQAKIPQAENPQRRLFSPSVLLPVASGLSPSYENRVSELLPVASGLSPSEDYDPIYTYDLNGNRTSMIDPTGITTYTYDALNRLTSVTNNKDFTTTFTYDALGRRTSITHGNGVATSYQYDAASQLIRLAHQLGATAINSFDYTYDRVGNRKTKVDRNGTASYTYDTLNRLIEAINPLPTNPLESFTYDAVGNRTNSNQNGASVFNQTNQLTEDANFSYQYDANGNQIRKANKTTGEFTTYEYTAENQLVRVVKNGTVINYKFDGLGRRVEKEINDGATTKVTRFIYDNEDILLELDGSNNITARYTHGPGIDEPLIMEKGGASFFYHADGLGSITELTNSSGTVVQSYTYSSFGKIESQLDPNFIQPYAFTGREFDPETGLYFYRARSYDMSSGRFLSEDPIWLLGSEPNGYRYVFNNPLNRTDPSGLWALVDDIIFTAGGALVGVVGQGLGDLLYGTRGNWQDYVGAAFGGAVGGELLLYTGPVVAAAGGAASANFTKQSLNIISGRQCGYDALSYLVDTGIGTVTGMFKGLGIPGISAGRNSFNAIYNQMATKLQTGQISKVRPQTGFKMFVGRFEATGGVPGSGAAVGGSGLGNLLSFDTCPCQ